MSVSTGRIPVAGAGSCGFKSFIQRDSVTDSGRERNNDWLVLGTRTTADPRRLRSQGWDSVQIRGLCRRDFPGSVVAFWAESWPRRGGLPRLINGYLVQGRAGRPFLRGSGGGFGAKGGLAGCVQGGSGVGIHAETGPNWDRIARFRVGITREGGREMPGLWSGPGVRPGTGTRSRWLVSLSRAPILCFT